MQGAHGVLNMTSLATLHMCSSLLWEDRKASATLCLSNTFLGKQPKPAAQEVRASPQYIQYMQVYGIYSYFIFLLLMNYFTRLTINNNKKL